MDLLAGSIPLSDNESDLSFLEAMAALDSGLMIECVHCPCPRSGDVGVAYYVDRTRTFYARTRLEGCWVTAHYDNSPLEKCLSGWSDHRFKIISTPSSKELPQ